MAKQKNKPTEAAESEVKEEAVETETVETEAVEAESTEPEISEAEEVKTEETGATEEAVEEAKEETKPKMYVGPTLTGIGIQNRVYTEIPSGAVTLIKEVPEFGNLFIDIEKYGDANRMLRERTGYIYNAFQKALEIKNNK